MWIHDVIWRDTDVAFEDDDVIWVGKAGALYGMITATAKMAGTVTGRAKMAGAVMGQAKMIGTVINITSQ